MQPGTFAYFATCAKGLEPAVAAELRDPRIGAQEIQEGASGVNFRGDQAVGYRANLWLRGAIRVLAEHARGMCPGSDQLYAWARTLDWTALMRLEQTFSVEARVWDSGVTHSKYAALRIKDALCDTFREKTGARPNVQVENADLPLFLYLYRDEAILYRDLSGTTLHKRGYRDAMHKSSLSETVAAGVLLRSGYDGSQVLCDPMCGAGTFGIEAALLALRRAPGLARRQFPFERWPDFDASTWKNDKERAQAEARQAMACPILLNDVHPGALALARKDSVSAGVDAFLKFSNADITDFTPPQPPNLVVVNPPWGERMDEADLPATWKKLGAFLKERCRSATAWVLTGNPDLTTYLGLKSSLGYTVNIAKLRCRVFRYDL